MCVAMSKIIIVIIIIIIIIIIIKKLTTTPPVILFILLCVCVHAFEEQELNNARKDARRLGCSLLAKCQAYANSKPANMG